jgi:hypothetical protein
MKPSIFVVLSLALSASAAQAGPWTQLAQCETLDNETAGVGLYRDGANLILQVATATESLDEYRLNAGAVTPMTLDLDQVQASLARGEPQSLLFTKPDSTEAGGMVSKAALFTLRVYPRPIRIADSMVARRGQLIRFNCHRLTE